ncbi:hypothetical protein WG66_009200 [Moniliophthora roreri]|nr:hypothetical protein WG66_002555 [Moniliophthora roreri]KAI3621587.1 hypothetical protein WG66_009200 [Moniliophthora roreri]
MEVIPAHPKYLCLPPSRNHIETLYSTFTFFEPTALRVRGVERVLDINRTIPNVYTSYASPSSSMSRQSEMLSVLRIRYAKDQASKRYVGRCRSE